MSFFTYYIKPSNYGNIGSKTNIVITPSTVDTKSTTLQLPGQSKTNYGEFYNQNLFRMLEHFSSANPPEQPTSGQVWYQPTIITPVTDPTILAQVPPNPICSQYWNPNPGSIPCTYIDQYCDISYVTDDYLESLTCIPIIDPLTLNSDIMWSCATICQDITFSTPKISTDSTGLLNDTTVYTATISINGVIKTISIIGSVAQTFTTLLVDLNKTLNGIATVSLVGGNIRITATTTNTTTIITTVDNGTNQLFSSLSDFVNIGLSHTTSQWVQRTYVQRLRVYTGSYINEDPNYPGWTIIQLKETTPPADPKCGDLYFNPTGSHFQNTLGDILLADTLYYWDCVISPNQWSLVGEKTFVRIDGTNTPMTGLLYLLNNSPAAIDAATGLNSGDIAVSKDWAVRRAGDTLTGFLILNDDPSLPLHAVTKQYTDYWNNAYDYARYFTNIPTDLITPVPGNLTTHPLTVNGRQYWDTLYRRNDGTLEVNNVYWRNLTDDIKDKLNCALGEVFQLSVGQIPPDFYTQPYSYFKPWVEPRDKALFLTYGFQPVEITLTIDLIQTANYSTVTGPGGMLNVAQHINVNNALMLHLRQVLGDPTYTIHSEEFGGKFSIVDTSLNPISVDVKQRAQLPQINRITGYTLFWGIPSTTYPGTNIAVNQFDMDWMLFNLGATYVGPPGFGGAGDTRLSINPATNKTRDDVNQRWIWHIHVDDSMTGTLNQYVIRYARPYSITNGNVDSLNYIDVESGGVPPNYVQYMARIYANWQYNDYDLRALLARNGAADPNSTYQSYCPECAGQPSTVLTNSLGLYYITSGTGPGAEQYVNYLTWAPYTAGLTIGVTGTNFNHINGDLDLIVAITNGTVGYSNFPSNLLVNKATVPITFKFFPAIGFNPNTGKFESIIDLPSVFANHCNW